MSDPEVELARLLVAKFPDYARWDWLDVAKVAVAAGERQAEIARVEGRAEGLNGVINEMELDEDAELVARRAQQWEQEAAHLRRSAVAASPTPRGAAPVNASRTAVDTPAGGSSPPASK